MKTESFVLDTTPMYLIDWLQGRGAALSITIYPFSTGGARWVLKVVFRPDSLRYWG
jgi:hypothetical protein